MVLLTKMPSLSVPLTLVGVWVDIFLGPCLLIPVTLSVTVMVAIISD